MVVDWSKVKPCGASNLTEYYSISKESGEIRHVSEPTFKRANLRSDGENCWFCREEYNYPTQIDLCRDCCLRYGFIW